MMSIKIETLRLNNILSSDQNSDMKTVYSKKLSPFSTIIELLHLEKDRLSPGEFSKIKQKLDDFYHLDCKRPTELRDGLEKNTNIKSDKAVDELELDDKKDEEDDSLNTEGLLLTQRRIYSQIYSSKHESTIEQKNVLHHGSQKNTTTSKMVIENNLKLNCGESPNHFEDNKEINKKFNKLTAIENNKVSRKIEKKIPVDKKEEKIESKDYPREDDKLNTKDSMTIENKNVSEKITYSETKEKNKNTQDRSIIENNKLSEEISYSKTKEKNKNIKDGLIIGNNNVSEKISYSDNKEINRNTVEINIEDENSHVENKYKEKIREKNNDILPLYNVMSEYQKISSEPVSDRKILDIPAFSILYKKVSTLSQPPSITYIFKKWGKEYHQMKVNFGVYKQIQLIASTGRVYQSSLESFSQYQGRLSLSLESDNNYWHVNEIDSSSENKEDKK